MPIPDYESLMLPLLVALSDNKEHPATDVRKTLGAQLALTDAEFKQLLPGGTGLLFNSRVGWAKTYLSKAGLVRIVRRGVYAITDEGRALLATKPTEVNSKLLLKYPSFRTFIGEDEAAQAPEPAQVSKATPQEQFEAAYLALRRQTEHELLELTLKGTPKFFEDLVVALLVRMGYGGSFDDAGQAIGQTGDGGIDGVIKEDVLGLDAVYVQAKRWKDNNVGRPAVQAFVGALEGHRARKGVFITTSGFSSDAREYVKQIDKRVVLIDGARLTQLMFEHGLGVSTEATFERKKIDTDFFEES